MQWGEKLNTSCVVCIKKLTVSNLQSALTEENIIFVDRWIRGTDVTIFVNTIINDIELRMAIIYRISLEELENQNIFANLPMRLESAHYFLSSKPCYL